MSDPTQPPVNPTQPDQPLAPATQMVPQQQPGQQAPPPQAYPQQPQQPGYPPQQGYPPQPQQGYPPQPGYPPQQPGLPPGAVISRPPAGSNFSSGKTKTIGLIVAGVVAVGAIGGIGALVLGGGGDDDKAPSASSPGQNSGILTPQPVGSAPPVPNQPVEPTVPAEPTEPAAPTPSPEPEPPAEPPAGEGSFVTLSGNGLQVYVPPGWQADAGEAAVILNDGNGAFSFVLTGSGDPALEASALINQNLEALLPSASYTYELSNPAPLGPSGAIVSLASVDYDGTYVDAQSPLPVTGRIFGATRSDGAVMLVLVEHESLEAYNASSDDYNLLLNETLNAFGGS